MYGLIQVCKASYRQDPEHYDGGASLMHGGLAIWGQRTVEHQSTIIKSEMPTHDDSGDLPWQGIPLKLGTLYIGNVCAAKHRVVHRKDVQHLFKRVDDSEGVHNTVMLRTDVFRGCHARAMIRAPSPNCVYEAVSRATARFIFDVPFQMPAFANVFAELIS